MTLFEITIGRRRFAVVRESDGRDRFYQTYYVDGRDVAVQHYLKMIALATGRETEAAPHETARGRSHEAPGIAHEEA